MKAINFLSKSARAINILLEIESILDSSGLYVFDGWMDGEIVNPPLIKGKWVYLTLKYETMPDKRALTIFDNMEIRYKFVKSKKTIYFKDLVGDEVENAYGYGYANTLPLDRTPEPTYKTIYILYLMIPKSLIEYIFLSKEDELLDVEEEEDYEETIEETSEKEEAEGLNEE